MQPLPAHIPASQAPGGVNPVLPSVDSLGVERPAATRPRVLLLEDDPTMATLVKSLLDVAGCEVLHFNDGAKALMSIPGFDFRLVILDILVPQMSGFDVLQNLRQIPGLGKLPVLLLTGMRRPEDIVRGMDLGADDYIVKPFEPAVFQARVRRLLHRADP